VSETRGVFMCTVEGDIQLLRCQCK